MYNDSVRDGSDPADASSKHSCRQLTHPLVDTVTDALHAVRQQRDGIVLCFDLLYVFIHPIIHSFQITGLSFLSVSRHEQTLARQTFSSNFLGSCLSCALERRRGQNKKSGESSITYCGLQAKARG
jgi:hypothetical protein